MEDATLGRTKGKCEMRESFHQVYRKLITYHLTVRAYSIAISTLLVPDISNASVACSLLNPISDNWLMDSVLRKKKGVRCKEGLLK